MNDNLNNCDEYNSFREILVPYLTGALALFAMPTTSRYFKQNPMILNPNKSQIPKLYWDNSPRYALALVAGLVPIVHLSSGIIARGIEKILVNNDYSDLVALGIVLASTNLTSATYEMMKK